MIIKSDNERISMFLSAVCLRMPDDGEWSTATATAKQLDGLCSVLIKPEYAGQWSVKADEDRPRIDAKTLTANLEDKRWQAMMLAPGAVGGDTEDLIYFVENICQLPIDNNNWQRVLQLFRLWYAATCPDEYHEPQWRDASKSGVYLSLRYDSPPKAKSRQTQRRNRLTEAAQSVGFATVDRLAAALLAAPPEAQAAIKKILKQE